MEKKKAGGAAEFVCTKFVTKRYWLPTLYLGRHRVTDFHVSNTPKPVMCFRVREITVAPTLRDAGQSDLPVYFKSRAFDMCARNFICLVARVCSQECCY